MAPPSKVGMDPALPSPQRCPQYPMSSPAHKHCIHALKCFERGRCLSYLRFYEQTLLEVHTIVRLAYPFLYATWVYRTRNLPLFFQYQYVMHIGEYIVFDTMQVYVLSRNMYT